MEAVFQRSEKAAGKRPPMLGRVTVTPLSVRYTELLALRRKLLEAERFNRHDLSSREDDWLEQIEIRRAHK
jgi:hypothetical protein